MATKTKPKPGHQAGATPHHSPELDAIRLHAQAENALSMARRYLRQSVSNLPGASRQAVRALDAISLLRIGDADQADAANDAQGGNDHE